MEDTQQQGNALLGHVLIEWYGQNYRARNLPWRNPLELTHRVMMVEGLLAQTRAPAVGAHYHRIFDGVTLAEQWLELSEDERLHRVAPLGLPRMKRDAVNSIASVLASETLLNIERYGLSPFEYLQLQPGLGPYIAGMIALLLGAEAAPVDTNILRVGERVDPEGDAKRWICDVVDSAMQAPSVTGNPPAYEAVCAVMDIGATLCKPSEAFCDRCPLEHLCAGSSTMLRQMSLFLD